MVPPISHKVPRVSWYSGSCSSASAFVYGALTLSGRLSQNRSTSFRSLIAVHDPGVHARRFGLFRFRSPLLTESLLFSFPPGTKMFQFPGFLLTNSYVGSDWTLLQPGSPIRIPPDRCLFTTPRGVSPLTASFISCMCLGIRRTLFLT